MKIDLLGVKINAEPKETILREIGGLLQKGRPIFITTPYSESVVAAQKDEEFRNVLNSADFALPDGIGLLWAAKFLNTPPPQAWGGQGRGRWFWLVGELLKSLLAIIFYPKYIRDPIPEKISGSEFVWDLTRLAAQNNYSIYLLGGFAQTAALVAQRLKSLFPNLKIAGTYPGNPSEQGIVEKINGARPDFLFVAFGPKTQEKWISQSLPKLRIRLAIGLGGTFDYLAGKRPYRPKKWALRGLEWLWRLLTQPWRLGRIFRGVGGLIYYSFRFKVKQL